MACAEAFPCALTAALVACAAAPAVARAFAFVAAEAVACVKASASAEFAALIARSVAFAAAADDAVVAALFLAPLTKSNKLLVELLSNAANNCPLFSEDDDEPEDAEELELELELPAAVAKPLRRSVVASTVRMFIFDCDFEY